MHVFSTVVKDFPKYREKKKSILKALFCPVIFAGPLYLELTVCITLFTNCHTVEIWALVKQVPGIYLQLFRWVRKYGKIISEPDDCACFILVIGYAV